MSFGKQWKPRNRLPSENELALERTAEQAGAVD
jgi:hypothetical protein